MIKSSYIEDAKEKKRRWSEVLTSDIQVMGKRHQP